MLRLRITTVQPGKGAERAGLASGDVIDSVDGKAIESNDDLSLALRDAGDAVRLEVFRDGALMAFTVTEKPLGIVAQTIDYDRSAHYQGAVGAEAMDLIRAKQIEKVVVTTTPSVEGCRVVRVVDVISAECVFGMNVFRDFFAALTDIFGGRSGASQKVLRDARKTCIHELKAEAHSLGANAVIGVSLDYSELSGQGKSMLFLVATGTAVILAEDQG